MPQQKLDRPQVTAIAARATLVSDLRRNACDTGQARHTVHAALEQVVAQFSNSSSAASARFALGLFAPKPVSGAAYSNVDHPEQVVAEEDNARWQRKKALPIY